MATEWHVFPLGAPVEDLIAAQANVPQVCPISAIQQDSMEKDTQTQTAAIAQMLAEAHVAMSSAAIAGSDELQIGIVLKMYPSMQRVARMWAAAFQQTSQLLQANAVLMHSEAIPTLLRQGLEVLRMMEVARHSLSIGSPTMDAAIQADEAELRELLCQLHKDVFSKEAQKFGHVSVALCRRRLYVKCLLAWA